MPIVNYNLNQSQTPCPSCGYCPTCGRFTHPPQPYLPPEWPNYPRPYWDLPVFGGCTMAWEATTDSCPQNDTEEKPE